MNRNKERTTATAQEFKRENYTTVIGRDVLDKYSEGLDDLLRTNSYSHYLQSREWYECAKNSEKYFFIVTIASGKVIASSLVRERHIFGLGRSKYFIDRGPVALDLTAFEEHLKGIRLELSRKALWIRLNPYVYGEHAIKIKKILIENGYEPAETSSSYSTSLVIDLSKELEQIKKQFRKGLRSSLSQAEKSGMEVRDDASQMDFEVFRKNHNDMASENSLTPIDRKLGDRIYNVLLRGGEKGKFYTANYGGEQVGAAIFLASGNRVIYVWGVSSRKSEHRKLSMSHMLVWQGIKWAKEQGYSYFDMGGYWKEAGNTNSINNFKSGFTKEMQDFVPEYKLVLSPLTNNLISYLGAMNKLFNK